MPAKPSRRWLFADQLGPAFLDAPKQPVLLIESKGVFRRRRFHRQKAHYILSALRHRAAELGDQGVFLQTETYRDALTQFSSSDGAEPLSVCAPTSRGADRFVRSLDGSDGLPSVEVLPERGYGTTRTEFAAWAGERGGRRLLMEDFYRRARLRHGLLMDGDEPTGGKWNLDHDNREPPPKADRLAVKEPYWPSEDEIDEQVRADLDRWEAEDGIEFVGADGPRRFAATRREALAALRRFIADRLPTFGPYEDAMLAEDWTMAHSLLSAPMNLGLIDPLECAQRAEQAYRNGDAPLQSVEGYVRQLIGWRDYIWNIYWHVAEPDYRKRNFLDANEDLPAWFADLDADAVEARCLSDVLAGVRDRAWVHHIPRLMVLGNYALQRGWNPEQLTDWFHRCFIDGYDWVMLPNVVGMSQHADGGLMATKPYASGGAYINRMSDYCSGCAFDPTKRLGETACPYTAGYWWFLARNEDRLSGNARMRRPLQGLHRLKDVSEVVAQEQRRGNAVPRVDELPGDEEVGKPQELQPGR